MLLYKCNTNCTILCSLFSCIGSVFYVFPLDIPHIYFSIDTLYDFQTKERDVVNSFQKNSGLSWSCGTYAFRQVRDIPAYQISNPRNSPQAVVVLIFSAHINTSVQRVYQHNNLNVRRCKTLEKSPNLDHSSALKRKQLAMSRASMHRSSFQLSSALADASLNALFMILAETQHFQAVSHGHPVHSSLIREILSNLYWELKYIFDVALLFFSQMLSSRTRHASGFSSREILYTGRRFGRSAVRNTAYENWPAISLHICIVASLMLLARCGRD